MTDDSSKQSIINADGAIILLFGMVLSAFIIGLGIAKIDVDLIIKVSDKTVEVSK